MVVSLIQGAIMDDIIRYRIGFLGKVILQVKKVKTIKKHNTVIELPYWSDATFFDLQEIQALDLPDEPNKMGFSIDG
jgi:hypothetical protein